MTQLDIDPSHNDDDDTKPNTRWSALFSCKSDEWSTDVEVFDDLHARTGPFTLDVCASPGMQRCETYFAPVPRIPVKLRSLTVPLADLVHMRHMFADDRKGRGDDPADYTPTAAIAHLLTTKRLTLADLGIPDDESTPPAGWDGLAEPWAAHVGDGVAWCNPPYSEIEDWMRKAVDEAAQGVSSVFLLPVRTCRDWFHDLALLGDITFCRGRLRFGGAKSTAPFPSMVVAFDAGRIGRAGSPRSSAGDIARALRRRDGDP